jgi:hypothetical protein
MRRSFAKFTSRLDAIGLREKVEANTLASHVSLRDLYAGQGRVPSIAAARRAIYLWLMKEGKGVNEIARLFDRASNGVSKLTRDRSGE